MSDVFRKQTTVWKLNGRKVPADSEGAARHVLLSRKWYGTVGGRQVPLCSDKTKAKQILAKLTSDAALASHGLSDPYAECKKQPLAEHLNDFRTALLAKGDTAEHIDLTLTRVCALLDGIGAVFVADLDATLASNWLSSLRQPRRVVTLPEGKADFTPREVAKLLGVSGAAVRSAVKRHSLASTGLGKARRLSRAAVEALVERLGRGRGLETVNHYVRAVRSFLRWLVKVRRLPSNPLDSLALLNSQVEVRHARRELTVEELCRLLGATRESAQTFRGLSGRDRFTLYVTACGTGFRASALASLTPESFNLADATPTVILAARFNKNRKPRTQPIPSDVAALLRECLKDRPAGQAVWGGTWARDHRGAEMLRRDLEVASIPYITEGPDGPLHADFHALRHSYITALGRGGVDLRTAQELAGHSTPVLTARYSHRRLYDLAGAVEKLPNFLPQTEGPKKNAGVVPIAATGTDGSVQVCTGFARSSAPSLHLVSSTGTGQGGERQSPETTQPPVLQGVGHLPASPVISSHQRGRRESNPQPPDRQSGTLTN